MGNSAVVGAKNIVETIETFNRPTLWLDTSFSEPQLLLTSAILYNPVYLCNIHQNI